MPLGAEEASASDGVPLLLGLPEDVLGLIARSLRPADVCSLILCCRGLRDALSSSDKVWLALCEGVGPHPAELSRWRDAGAVPSYRSLCRFLLAVAPLLGIWVHQNPELGNVVCVVWGFASVVGCRVIPQELGPLGLDGGPLLWAPVFEVVAGPDGSPAFFFLHGRERDAAADSICAGSVGPIDPACNLLLLEIEVGGAEQQQLPAQLKPQALPPTNSSPLSGMAPDNSTGKLRRSSTSVPRVSLSPQAPLCFSRLAFGDRRKLLELVAPRVRLDLPSHLAEAPLFPRSPSCKDFTLLAERRLSLIQLQKLHSSCVQHREIGRGLDMDELNRSLCRRDSSGVPCAGGSRLSSTLGKRRSFSFSMGGYLKGSLRQILGKTNRANGAASEGSRNCCRSPISSSSAAAGGDGKHVHLHEFLMLGDMLRLCLHASKVKLTKYRGWPHMQVNRFALYKLPLQIPVAGQEYAGLWGGTFGWPPVQPSENKPGKALFFILLSYEEAEGKMLLIGTKILEGTHHVQHPNGSAMFTVKVDEPALDTFPWDVDADSKPVEVHHSYSGEGIADGSGFHYPGSKPGSLFAIQDELLAFVWKDPTAVLTLQRLDLQDLLRKGERVPARPPIANFAYLTESASKIFHMAAQFL
uniref:F-box protein At5g39450 n=1 Tax=Anthurium amnicola TaxID=1678845 RepID=A0A1D1YHP3_9ARAE